MEQEKVWDMIAEKWSKFRSKTVKEVVDFLKDKNGKVLDLGCGSGRNFVKNNNLYFYGLDFSQNLLKIASKKNYIELKKGLVYDIPYKDGFFDYVVFVRVLHCVETEEKRLKGLREVYRVLKKDGEAVISTIGRGNQRVKNKPRESILPWTVGNVKYERYNYIYDLNELEIILKSVGFEIVSIKEGKNIIAVVKK